MVLKYMLVCTQDLRKERLQRQSQFEELLVNMTAVQKEVAALRVDVTHLRGGVLDEQHAKKGKVIE